MESDWKNDDDDSLINSTDDIDGDDSDYNMGFSNVDTTDETDVFKAEDDIEEDVVPIDFAPEEDEVEESFEEEISPEDDFETVDISDDDEYEDDDEEDDDFDFGSDDLLGKKK